MNRSLLRWASGAAASAVAATVLASPTPGLAASDDSAFCADGSVPMVTQQQSVDLFETDPTHVVRGLTVVRGTTPEEFTGTYVGHIENALGKGVDMLLFRLSGLQIDSGEKRGIWAGMSGSPVYTADGRLIGAVAYGLSPDDVPIAGITPADYMKKVGTDRLGSGRSVPITRRNLQAAAVAPSSLASHTARPLKAVKVMAGGTRANGALNRIQAKVPGASPSASAARAGGFGAVGSPTTISDPIVPGGNIAVGYSTGDIFSGSVGTVTAVCGSTVWAFGHPMDFIGETSLSIHNASAALVVPDSTGWSGSYKQVASIGQQVGTITNDGYGAIRGELGLHRGFPVTTRVKNASGRLLDVYRGTVVDPWMATNAAMAPAMAIYDIVDNVGIGSARHTWRIDYRLRNGKTGTLKNRQVYAGLGDLADQVASGLGGDIAALAYTDLADVTITSVTSTLTLTDDRAVDLRLTGATWWNPKKRAWVKLDGKRLRATRTHRVRPVYRTYVNGRPRAKSVGPVVRFSPGAKARGAATLTFEGLADASSGEECFELDGEEICIYDEEPVSASTFAELVAELDRLTPADRARAKIRWTTAGAASSGKTKVKRQRFTLPGPVSGSHTATFTIRR